MSNNHIQIVKDFFSAMGCGDREGLLALSAEDIEWIIRARTGRWPARTAGTRDWRICLQKSELLETSTEPIEFVAQGDRVLVIGFARGKVLATNKTFEDDWSSPLPFEMAN